MKIATWNIYWLGDRSGKIDRAHEDEKKIAAVIEKMSPEVLALQEIVDPRIMERTLLKAKGPGRNYTMRAGGNGAWLTSDPDPVSSDFQKAFLCYNREAVEFVRGSAIRGGPNSGRKPYAAVLRHRESGREFIAVAVHLRSGYPNFLDPDDAETREREAKALALWLRGEAAAKNPDFPKPEHLASDTEGLRVAVLGDFNAELDDPNDSLDPLALPGWTWNNPRPDGDRRETALYNGDRLVIDFIILSPELAAAVRTAPSVYAWDFDPDLGGPGAFHVDAADPDSDLKDYKVSDHRPVYAEFDF